MSTRERNASRARKDPHTKVAMLLLDVAVPLVMFYGLRSAGVNQWLALMVSGLTPIGTLTYRLITERRLEIPTLFTLSILLCGTAVGLLTGDPRLLLARESYLTGLLGLWMIGTLFASRPFILISTLPLLPERTAEAWEASWQDDPSFRRVMRFMTFGWGSAFLLDAVARVVMAYTLPLDVVPLLGVLLLVVLLVTVVGAGKFYGRRQIVDLARLQ